MSIFNDNRQFSDDEKEHQAWKTELERECRRDYYEPEEEYCEGESDDRRTEKGR